jgi:hypothetical protein
MTGRPVNEPHGSIFVVDDSDAGRQSFVVAGQHRAALFMVQVQQEEGQEEERRRWGWDGRDDEPDKGEKDGDEPEKGGEDEVQAVGSKRSLSTSAKVL